MTIKVKDTLMQVTAMHALCCTVKHTKGLPVELESVRVTKAKLVLIEVSENITQIGLCLRDMKLYKPILISETEKVEVGDISYCSYTGNINTWSGFEKKECCYKLLALPEHFSPEQLQMIIDDKLKDGDKVLVECYTYNEFKGGRGEQSGFYIKFNSSNHITFHKIEEKMYTEAELIKIIGDVANDVRKNGFGGMSVAHAYAKRWVEQNLK